RARQGSLPPPRHRLPRDARRGRRRREGAAARRADRARGARHPPAQRLADPEAGPGRGRRRRLDEPQPLRGTGAVLRLVVDRSHRQPRGARGAIHRIQKDRRDAVHHLGLAEARRDEDLRARGVAAGAARRGTSGGTVTTREAPRAFNRTIYHNHPEMVFYGTDDGAQDGSFREFSEIKAHYDGVPAWRHDDVHMISVVGGLYGLNLIPLWKPKRITIFDINPAAITYFQLIRQVWTTSRDVGHFLARLTAGDYDA